ncbi:MAG TPA: hypothetical protein VKQ32_28020 [Polyangia bacterium]|nr:hypothetical protein [Polyangia bacterium]
MPSSRLPAAALAGALLIVAGCSNPDSFVVLSLRSATPAAITGIVTIQVDVSSATIPTRSLFYQTKDMMMIDEVTERTLSVGFSGNESGTVTFVVTARDGANCSLGSDSTRVQIVKGGVAHGGVSLGGSLDCTGVDAGTPDAPVGTPLPGCDPVSPQNPPANDGGVATCTATQTCQVDCTPDAGMPRNECITGGTGKAGTTCTKNADCEPGTQCFNYSNTGCSVGLCLRFCNNDTDCTPVGAGGGGPGSFCQGPVMCPTFLTAYHTCTFNCDPRATAAATKGGCPGGLACVMPGDHDQVDCACPQATRIKTEGMTCTSAADCAPGLICNRMNNVLTCRAICRCDANANVCTAPNDCPTTGTSCKALTNNTIYGVCL